MPVPQIQEQIMEVLALPEVQVVAPIKEHIGESIMVCPPELTVKRTLSRSTS